MVKFPKDYSFLTTIREKKTQPKRISWAVPFYLYVYSFIKRTT